MHFCIRDDDTNFFTQPEELEQAYGRISSMGPVSLAVVPVCRAGTSKAVPEKLRGRWSVHPLHENAALVQYLREKVASGAFEIMLHGYYHDEPHGRPEFAGGNDLHERVVAGRRYLEDLLATSVRVFVPPHNSIGRRGLRAIAREGLHLGGAAGVRGGWPLVSAKTWTTWLKLRKWRRDGGVGVPWVLDMGDHREIGGNPVTPLSTLKRNELALDRAADISGVFCAATHYWELPVRSQHAGDPNVGGQLARLIERALSRPGTAWQSVGDVVCGASGRLLREAAGLKIALVDDVLYRYASGDPSAVGGAERYMWLLTRALAANGWSAVVGVRAGLASGERVRIDNVDFVGLEQRPVLGALYRFLASEKPDWCHWFGADHLLGPAVGVAKVTGTRTVFSAQFDLDVRPRRALYRRPRLWPFYAAGLLGANRIFLQHSRQYTELPVPLRSKARIVPGVVDLPTVFKTHGERERYVAWVGVLRQPKRPDLLIEIARKSPGIDFVVCGGTSSHRSPTGYGDAIVAEFKTVRNIHHMGHVAPARAIEIIGRASLLLSTSEAEGFPSVFLEAWAHGTPVVSLTIDPDGAIAKERLGVVSNGVEGAVAAISNLIESDHERQNAAIRCRSYVARIHSAAAAVGVVERALGRRDEVRPQELSQAVKRP